MICGHDADIGVEKVPCGHNVDIKNHILFITFYYLKNGRKIAEPLNFTGFPLS